jgi:hypothetical protein
VKSVAQCNDAGGIYHGDGASCGDFGQYASVFCIPQPFDISTTGKPILKEGAEKLLGFEFPYFGSLHMQLGVSRRSYLAVGGGQNLVADRPAAIPDPAPPDNIIAVGWETYDLAATAAWHEPLPGPPDEHIFQWHVQTGANEPTARFQAILSETGSITLQLSWPPTMQPPAVGIENSGGTQGINIDIAALLSRPQPVCIQIGPWELLVGACCAGPQLGCVEPADRLRCENELRGTFHPGRSCEELGGCLGACCVGGKAGGECAMSFRSECTGETFFAGEGTTCLNEDRNGDGADDGCIRPGDANGDFVINCADQSGLNTCMEGPAAVRSEICAYIDMNGDGAVDLKDEQLFQNEVDGGCGN